MGHGFPSQECERDFPVVQWLKLHAPNAGSWGSILVGELDPTSPSLTSWSAGSGRCLEGWELVLALASSDGQTDGQQSRGWGGRARFT